MRDFDAQARVWRKKLMPAITRINRALALGFEEFEQALESAAHLQNEGYPPYNIERHVEPGTGRQILKIVLAVAGFSKDLLEVREEDNNGNVFLRYGSDTMLFDVEDED